MSKEKKGKEKEKEVAKVASKSKTIKEVQKRTSVLTEDAVGFLRNYINTPSAVGFESGGQKLWLDYIKPFVDTHFVDPYGTAVGVINPDAPFKVVIEAHCDEISWFVNYINNEGLIYVKRNGGVDHQIAPAKRVLIHGKKGAVKAVFGWPAIHTRLSNPDNKEPVAKVDNLFLDCGARNKKEVEELGIHIGSVITYEEGFDVQEEIGLRGAEMIARRIKPNIAIITDVTHDTQTPMINKIIEGDVACGKGPSPCYGPAVHNKLLKIVEEVAEKNNIPLQMRTVSRSTGTDTDSFAYANDGCPSVLISIPLRYMHTTVEMLHKDDIDSTVQLMYETLLTLSPDTNLSYI